MTHDLHLLAQRLAAQAEAVCAHYLSNGCRSGRYWHVGDVHNTPGRSLYVRLAGPVSGRGAAGKWCDAATGEHGDLVDLIRANRDLTAMREVVDEILRFLVEPRVAVHRVSMPRSRAEAARRLFAAAQPVPGTLGETYLRSRGITCPLAYPGLRFHPACYHRDRAGLVSRRPALVAAATDLVGVITGVQRTYLADDGRAKAPVAAPRKALGTLYGHGVRLGAVRADVLAAGEGLETMLALKTVLPELPMVAALSAGHLAALVLPPGIRALYVAADNDPAGRRAAARLIGRAMESGIQARLLVPDAGDWNDALRLSGAEALRRGLAAVMTPF